MLVSFAKLYALFNTQYSQSEGSTIFTVAGLTVSPPWCYLFMIILTSLFYSHADSESAMGLLTRLVAYYIHHEIMIR